MDEDTVEMLECTGNIVRTYENQRTGEVVSVFVIVGPAGPIAVHTPEICYSSQNYKSRDTRQQVAIRGRPRAGGSVLGPFVQDQDRSGGPAPRLLCVEHGRPLVGPQRRALRVCRLAVPLQDPALQQPAGGDGPEDRRHVPGVFEGLRARVKTVPG